MAPGNYYHLEGTYPAVGELRVYMYDDHTKPTSSAKISGKATFKEHAYDLKPVEGTEYLKAELPKDANPPISVSADVNLPDPSSGKTSMEHFDFDFPKLTEDNPQGEAKPAKAVRKSM